MKIVLLTQPDPFYLAHNIKYLLEKMPGHSQVVSAILFDVSPFGKKESFLGKMKETYRIFGLRFFINYGFKYVLSRFNPAKSVKRILEKHNVQIVKLNHNINHHESIDIIKAYKPDLLISIAGNQIFKKELLEIAPKGCLNLHTALLPKYRGLMPSFWVLKNSEKETGVSVFFVDEGIDSGPILVQKRIPITAEMTQASLIKLSKRIGMDAVLESINLIEKGDYITMPNPEEEHTYYSFPTRQDVITFCKAGKRFY